MFIVIILADRAGRDYETDRRMRIYSDFKHCHVEVHTLHESFILTLPVRGGAYLAPP